jgi:capsular exopolysaccharide synthesis family protein
MSHIFDALQRSEAEQTGVDLRALSIATELLEMAERRAAGKGGTADSAPFGATKIADGETPVPPEGLLPLMAAVDSPAADELELPLKANGSDQFGQFRSLPVMVSAESRLVCLTDKESLAAEKFRFLGVRLRQLQQKRLLKKVLITSSIPQEGKSMVAANLACTLARRARQRTLLVEGDLRRPALSRVFGLDKMPGICEWLQGDGTPNTSIYFLEGPGLWMLPVGSTPRNPLELLQSGRLSAVMDQLTAYFDWIIIDSPPVLPLADTSIWMRQADGILLVTRQGTTEKQQLTRGLEAIEQSKLLGALLNSSTTTAHSNYYYLYGSPTALQSNGTSKQ